MKLLINLCAHDGIISHYTGVGTMLHKYIVMLNRILSTSIIDYKVNLITPEYHFDSFGYSQQNMNLHSVLKNMEVVQISNGSNGLQNFGNIENWQTLTMNTAKFINNQNLNDYDKIITIYNDVPFTCLANYLDKSEKHIKIWIPHSSAKIHNEDEFMKSNSKEYKQRLELEENAVNYINSNENCFLAYISDFMKEHFVCEYKLNSEKLLPLLNGEIFDEEEILKDISTNIIENFRKIENCESIIISFGRAEKYKNHEATMLLGRELGVQPVVVPHGYFKGQSIMNDYEKLAQETNAMLFIDAPYEFVTYILKNYLGKIIVLVPSIKEPMGLIVNEIRKLNKENILIIANNIPGLREQIYDGVDGLLINVDDIKESAIKIKKYFNDECMKKLSNNGFETVKKKYDFDKTFKEFFNKVIK